MSVIVISVIVQVLLLCFFLSVAVVFARQKGLMSDASDMLYTLQEVIRKVALLGGVIVFFSGFLQLRAYRRNPVQTPLSRCIWFFVVALLLIGINYLPSPLQG